MDTKSLAARMAAAQPAPVVSITLAESETKGATGSEDLHFNHKLLNDVMRTIPVAPIMNAEVDQAKAGRIIAKSTSEAMKAFEPKDAIEGMLAAQTVALHNGAMECLRRAATGQNSAEVNSRLRRDAANLARAMTDMLTALDRKRGKGQKIHITRVNVQQGSQAIIGPQITTSPALDRQTAASLALMAEAEPELVTADLGEDGGGRDV